MNKNSNLEFRKIPSLQFLYEVNSNGTIIRNVKSKRHLKCFKIAHNSKTEWCTQVNIKNKIIKVFLHRVVAECWHGKVVPVALIDSKGNRLEFETSKQAAKYLATIYTDKKEKSFSDKFHLRRNHIFDYDVEYI